MQFSYDFVTNSSKNQNGNNLYAGGTTVVTDARGNRLVYTYDDRGNITEVLDQDGNADLYLRRSGQPAQHHRPPWQQHVLYL